MITVLDYAIQLNKRRGGDSEARNLSSWEIQKLFFFAFIIWEINHLSFIINKSVIVENKTKKVKRHLLKQDMIDQITSKAYDTCRVAEEI